MCHKEQIMQEMFQDTKGVIRSHKSKKNRQYDGQKVQKDKRRFTKQLKGYNIGIYTM